MEYWPRKYLKDFQRIDLFLFHVIADKGPSIKALTKWDGDPSYWRRPWSGPEMMCLPHLMTSCSLPCGNHLCLVLSLLCVSYQCVHTYPFNRLNSTFWKISIINPFTAHVHMTSCINVREMAIGCHPMLLPISAASNLPLAISAPTSPFITLSPL